MWSRYTIRNDEDKLHPLKVIGCILLITFLITVSVDSVNL